MLNDILILKKGWIKWGGEGLGWYVDEDESTFDIPENPNEDCDRQKVKLRVMEVIT